ncbi:DUF3106 domain-containing protein [Azoarcus sp. L1K30]|uniref:DUF3106 domain-containing protein n=1 Tax=Azoarcus sp. L1K30 TaxID=2820277 RepID=UPI001B8374D9|nr:DUF3106 domain-containing protein [Azoarcus sp. L1K30]MBR0568871.1 DUF3106 domain-containing protein [Azoarcus sp. L1K30]
MAATRLLILICCLLLSAAADARITPVLAPGWSELAPHQQQALAPLAEDWDGMSAVSRLKWIGISNRYEHLSADEQSRIQARMRDWARLDPDARRRARDRYRAMQALPAERRNNLHEEWERYQNLPPEGRRPQDATSAPRRPGDALQGQANIIR